TQASGDEEQGEEVMKEAKDTKEHIPKNSSSNPVQDKENQPKVKVLMPEHKSKIS
ncbi:hypothetical protein S245_060714, partial [Arachis hypogaea]